MVLLKKNICRTTKFVGKGNETKCWNWENHGSYIERAISNSRYLGQPWVHFEGADYLLFCTIYGNPPSLEVRDIIILYTINVLHYNNRKHACAYHTLINYCPNIKLESWESL